MPAIARGCLEFLLVWLLAAAGFYTFLEPRYPMPGPIWAAAICSFFVASCWGLLRNSQIAFAQVRLIQDSLNGATPAADQPYAAIGRAVAIHQPLQTPFLERPCVLYSYELSENQRIKVKTARGTDTRNQRLVYFSGLAMTHWAVQTDRGPVAVCGFPVPDQFEETPVDTKRHYSRVREFCETTPFTQVGKWDVGKLLNFAGIVLRESSEPVRQDLWFDGADMVTEDRSLLQGCRLIEQSILIDAPICVIGKFDREQSGLVNDLMKGGLQVIPGDAAIASKQLRQRAIFYLTFAVILFLLATVGSWAGLELWQRELQAKQPAVDPAAQLTQAVEQNDLPRITELIAQGVAPETRDTLGRPLLLAAIDKNNQPLIELLLNNQVDVNAPQAGWNRTPLDAAFDRGNWELFDKLKTLGATGRVVEKSAGQPLNDFADLEALLIQYQQLLDASDALGLRAITDDWPEDYYESAGRGLYKDTVPVSWKLVEGYRNERLASLVVEGTLRSGGQEQHVITASIHLGRWKLLRTYWDQTRVFRFRP